MPPRPATRGQRRGAVSDRASRGDPAKEAAATAAVVQLAREAIPVGEGQPPWTDGGEKGRGILRLNRAVERFMRDGLDEDDYKRMQNVANRVLRERGPVDQARLEAKLGIAVEQMVDLIITGELAPRSASEAANVSDTLVKVLGVLKVDGAALAAAVSAHEHALDRKAQFEELLGQHAKNIEAQRGDAD